MKRFSIILLLLALVVSIVPTFAQDAEAPQGTFLGTWPYVLPPDHTLNSFTLNGGVRTNLDNAIYRNLVELPPAFFMWASGEYEPLLASSWGFTDDNTAYTFTINADAKWSDGDPVTSEDVIDTYAIGRILNWAQFSYISEVEAVDDHTVKFTFSGEPSLLAERLILKEPIVHGETYADFAQRALDLHASGATSDSEEWTTLANDINTFRPEELIASGPYTYTMADVGDAYMTLHWQPNSIFSDKVKFDKIRLWAGETEATTPLLLGNELAHSTNVYPASTIEQVQSQGIRTVILPRGYGAALLFNHDVAPLNVKEVRQAMAYAIDREENAFLTNGIGASGTVYMAGILDAQVPQLMTEAGIAALNRYEFNLDKAAELMGQAGYTKNDAGKWVDASGNTISLEYTFPAEFADFAGAAQNVIDQLNSFGFDITARALPAADASAAIRASDFQLSVWSWGNGSPFASRHFFGPTQRFNSSVYGILAEGQKGIAFPMEFEWEGQQINLNDLINNVSTGLDVEAQRERADYVAKIINEELPFIPLNVEYSVEPINETLVTGAPPDGDPILQNPSSGGDHFSVWYLLNGLMGPTDITRDYAG
jgi:peptide/nickel transport system substrate-binding protein